MAAGWYPGRCKDCSSEDLVGARCEACGRAHNAREAVRRAERKAKRLCWVCGDKAVKGLASCEDHRGTAWRA
jgi:cob(I)alamin adenosyltransferase